MSRVQDNTKQDIITANETRVEYGELLQLDPIRWIHVASRHVSEMYSHCTELEENSTPCCRRRIDSRHAHRDRLDSMEMMNE